MSSCTAPPICCLKVYTLKQHGTTKVYTIKEPSNFKIDKMKHLDITLEVAENPSREPIIKQREDGETEIIFQMTQQQMDEIIIKNLEKSFK